MGSMILRQFTKWTLSSQREWQNSRDSIMQQSQFNARPGSRSQQTSIYTLLQFTDRSGSVLHSLRLFLKGEY